MSPRKTLVITLRFLSGLYGFEGGRTGSTNWMLLLSNLDASKKVALMPSKPSLQAIASFCSVSSNSVCRAIMAGCCGLYRSRKTAI